MWITDLSGEYVNSVSIDGLYVQARGGGYFICCPLHGGGGLGLLLGPFSSVSHAHRVLFRLVTDLAGAHVRVWHCEGQVEDLTHFDDPGEYGVRGQGAEGTD